jgi:hypothetical protein
MNEYCRPHSKGWQVLLVTEFLNLLYCLLLDLTGILLHNIVKEGPGFLYIDRKSQQ